MRALVAIVVGLVALTGAERARAYPQFQLTQDGGATCGRCHVSPAGGGLLSDMGQFTAEEMSARGGEPAFLHDVWTPPAWLRLGGDIRLGVGGSDAGFGPGPAIAPMQAEVYAAVGSGAWTGYLSVGVLPDLLREHYLMYQPSTDGLYVRAGRFMPVYGLRLAEHVYATRRWGAAPLGGEVYGLSVGYTGEGYEAHLTGFVHDPLDGKLPLHGSVEKGDGAALYAEKRLGERAAIGVQARYARSDLEHRTAGGATGKVWLPGPRLLLQAEASMIRQRIGSTPIGQLAAQLVATRFFGGGVFVDLGLGRGDTDLGLAKNERDAVDLNVHWLGTSHLELVLSSRFAMVGLGDGGASTWYSLLQLHYRL
jgi:hypothetical protein